MSVTSLEKSQRPPLPVRLTVGAIAVLLAIGPADAEPVTLSPELQSPKRIEVDGQPIELGSEWGHAGPCVSDIDGDGKPDLIVGSFGGKFHYYGNIGSAAAPKYTDRGFLKADDEPAKVYIYCCIGSSPQLVDLNGDGIHDLVSGSYQPGAVYFFPGKGDGTFRKSDAIDGEYADRVNGEPLKDRAGRVILRKPDQREEWESFGCWPAPVDWDHDGDLDLLIGQFDGGILLRKNLGSVTEWSFSEEAVPVEADEKPLTELEYPHPHFHAAVVAADWNSDGLFDLVCGADDGSVRWYRNTGSKGEPKFTAAESLVPPATGDGYNAFLDDEHPLQPGIRTQVAVSDMNGDGKADLLVGDFQMIRTPRKNLSAEEQQEYRKARGEYVQATEKFMKQVKSASEEGHNFLKQFPKEEQVLEENQEKWRKKMEDLRAAEPYKAAEKEHDAALEALKPFLDVPEGSGTHDSAVVKAHVWLYLRK